MCDTDSQAFRFIIWSISVCHCVCVWIRQSESVLHHTIISRSVDLTCAQDPSCYSNVLPCDETESDSTDTSNCQTGKFSTSIFENFDLLTAFFRDVLGGGGGGGGENLNLIWTATSDYSECDMMHHNSKHREKNKCKQPDYISSFILCK